MKFKRLFLKGGRIIDPASVADLIGDLVILDGEILTLGQKLNPVAYEKTDQVIDCQGTWIVPGLIDLHVHLREPGQTHREDWQSGSRAAAAGGFVYIVAMANTVPVIDNISAHAQVTNRTVPPLIRVQQVAALTRGQQGTALVALDTFITQGINLLSDDGQAIQDPKLLKEAMCWCNLYQQLMLIHCQNKAFAQDDPAAEFTYVELCLGLSAQTGCPIHIQHVSTARSVELIREAKKRRVPVTAETCPHYFSLTEQDFQSIGPNAKMNPPLRSEADRQAVIAGLLDDTIDIITTDHAPHAPEEKALGIDKAPCGIIGLETALAVTLTTLGDKMSPLKLIAKLTSEPAKILGTAEFGNIQQFSQARITVIDPQAKKVVDPDKFYSKSRNCPWAGRELQGWPIMTIFGDNIVMKDGVILD
jgi:dihydroorotase